MGSCCPTHGCLWLLPLIPPGKTPWGRRRRGRADSGQGTAGRAGQKPVRAAMPGSYLSVSSLGAEDREALEKLDWLDSLVKNIL